MNACLALTVGHFGDKYFAANACGSYQPEPGKARRWLTLPWRALQDSVPDADRWAGYDR
jgi:hypothetical protein